MIMSGYKKVQNFSIEFFPLDSHVKWQQNLSIFGDNYEVTTRSKLRKIKVVVQKWLARLWV